MAKTSLSFRFFVYGLYVLIGCFLCYASALQTSISILAPQLMRDFSIGATGLGWIGGCFFFAALLLQIPQVFFFLQFSLRIVLTLALIVMVWGILFFGVAHTIFLLLVGRLCIGAGASFAFVGMGVIMVRYLPRQNFIFLLGIAGAIIALGGILGQLSLAIAVPGFGRAIVVQFLAVLGAMLAIFIWVSTQDYWYEKKMLLPRQKLATFFQEYVVELLKSKLNWLLFFETLFGFVPVTAFASFWAIPYLMVHYNIPVIVAASGCAMLWAGFGFGSLILPWLIKQWNNPYTAISTVSLLIAFLLSAVIFYLPAISWAHILLLFFGLGLAVSGQILTFARAKQNNPPELFIAAFSFNNLGLFMGGAICQPLMGVILDWHPPLSFNQGIPIYDAQHYNLAFSVVPACLLLATIMSCLSYNKKVCF